MKIKSLESLALTPGWRARTMFAPARFPTPPIYGRDGTAKIALQGARTPADEDGE